MEWSEATGQPMHQLFLDWKQAFDSIDHNAMLVALERFGISATALKVIQGIYSNPTFKTTSSMGEKAAGVTGMPSQPLSFHNGAYSHF